MTLIELITILFMLCDAHSTAKEKIDCQQKKLSCIQKLDGKISEKDILWRCKE